MDCNHDLGVRHTSVKTVFALSKEQEKSISSKILLFLIALNPLFLEMVPREHSKPALFSSCFSS